MADAHPTAQDRQHHVQITIIRFLGVFMLIGIMSVTWLVYWAADASSIAIIAGMTGTALGALGTSIVNERSRTTDAPPPAPATPPPFEGVQP